MNPLSLHHITAMDTTPAELISIAAQLGLHHVCLFVNTEIGAEGLFPCVWDAATRKEVARRCADEGVIVHNLESFDCRPGENHDRLRPALELGAELGARFATSHIYADDLERGCEDWARYCDVAGEYGITPCLEFTPLTPTKTLAEAVAVMRRIDRPNSGIALDTLHLYRSGGTAADVIKLEPGFIRSMQISDGLAQRDLGPQLKDYFDESCYERLIPGEAEFALCDLIKYVGPDMVIDVEVPLQSYKERGVPPLERARLAVAGARRLLEKVAAQR